MFKLIGYVYLWKQNYYFGCDCKMYHFANMKGVTFKSVVVGRIWCQTWKDHMENFALCHLLHVNWQANPSLPIFSINYVVCCVGSLQGLSLCWFVIDILRMAYGMSYTTIGKSTNWKMVLPLVHYANLSTYSYN